MDRYSSTCNGDLRKPLLSGCLAVPAAALSVALEPIQDLHGYGEPWPAGGGKNKINAPDITLAAAGDIYNGACVLEAGTYTLSSSNTTVSVSVAGETGTMPITFTLANDISTIQIEASGAGTFNNIMIESGSSATTFAPYSNICPISGRTEVNLGRSGKNLLPMTVAGIKALNTSGTWNGNVYTQSNLTFTILVDADDNVIGINVSGQASSNTDFKLAEDLTFAQDVILNGCPSGGSDSTYRLDYYVNVSAIYRDLGSGVTVPSGSSGFIRIRMNNTSSSYNVTFYPMLRDAATADDTFEPYVSPVTLTIALGTTVYGGTLGVKTGVVTVTDGYIASYNGETLPSTWISDRDVYAEGTTPTTGAEVVYKLATPTTIQLTGAELMMLKGYNSLSTDGGDVITITAYAINEEVGS